MKVVNISNKQRVYENVLEHFPGDFDDRNELYLMVKGTVYKSLAGSAPGCIGFNQIQRMHHYLSLSQSIHVEDIRLFDVSLDKIKLKISKRKKKTGIIIEKERLLEFLHQHFSNFFFIPDQILVFEYLGTTFNAIVLEGRGKIATETKIEVVTADLAINIVGQELISKDLFNDDYNFSDLGIGGLDDKLSDILRRALSSRAISPEIIKKLGIKHVKGMILHGPPGTGKTLIARNIGKMLSTKDPVIINGPELLNKFVGQSEENLRKIFEPARADFSRLGDRSDLHIFIFDEIDAIFRSRGAASGGTRSSVTDSLVNQLLTIMDGVDELPNIFLIAMTNRLDLIDEALLRPGRIEVKVEIGLPDQSGRVQILKIHTDKMKENDLLEPIDMSDLALRMENFSGAEIESVVKNACSFAINEALLNETDVVVKADHFEKSLKNTKPAFGNDLDVVVNLLPDEFKTNSSIDFMKSSVNCDRLTTILLSGYGKTSAVAKIATETEAKFVKFIRPIDVIRKSEGERSEFLVNMLMDAHISETSLVVLDDLEVLINFVDLNGSISFSNKLYQTLITILKTLPSNPQHRTTIITTTSSKTLINLLKDKVTHSITLPA